MEIVMTWRDTNLQSKGDVSCDTRESRETTRATSHKAILNLDCSTFDFDLFIHPPPAHPHLISFQQPPVFTLNYFTPPPHFWPPRFTQWRGSKNQQWTNQWPHEQTRSNARRKSCFRQKHKADAIAANFSTRSPGSGRAASATEILEVSE
jgi:hypothetical protein